MTFEGWPEPSEVLYSPALWGDAWIYVQHWLKTETALENSGWASPDTKRRINKEAIKRWKALEIRIMWDKDAQLPEFRRRYIDWLARERAVEEPGLNDVDISALPLFERIVAAGYRTLAKTAHPDVGGSVEGFRELRAAKMKLDRMVSEVAGILKEE